MHQSKKGNQWHFGMKAHIGVDADSGLVHTVRGTAGNVNDVVEGNSLLHGQEEFAFSDAGYQGVNKRPDARAHVGEAVEAGIVEDAIVAQSLDDAKSLWAYRESIGELLGRLKPFAAFDVGIPVPAMDGFVREVRLALAGRYPAGGHLFFGHIGDGNLHVLSGLHADPADLHDVEAAMYATTSRRRFDLGRAWGRLGQAPLPAPEPLACGA